MAKRRQSNRHLPVKSGEKATKERNQQSGGVTQEIVDLEASGKVYSLRYRARMECMLDAYLLRELITPKEHEAGMRYRMAWLRAKCGIKVIDRFTSGARKDHESHLMIIPESERILREADALLTRAQKKIVLRVCCDDKQAGGTDSLETLRRAFHRMCKHWGMI